MRVFFPMSSKKKSKLILKLKNNLLDSFNIESINLTLNDFKQIG